MYSNEINKNNLHQQDILVVDDNPASLQLLMDILNKAGYHARLASNGPIALRSVEYKPPDLILLDVKMPGMDGYEVCRRLKSNEKNRNIPVIFISGLSETTQKVQGFNAGGVDYIAKPFESEEIVARVNIHLRLRELTEQLEQRVEERTKELREANQLLQQEIVVRKEAERNLVLLNFAINNVHEAIFLVDRNAQLQFVNEESCRILGYPRSELLKMSVPDFDIDFPITRWAGHWDELTIKHSITFESRHKAKDNRVFPVEVNANYFEFDNKNYIMALVRDITERKQNEKILNETVSNLNAAQRIAHIGSWELDLLSNHLTWSDETYRMFEIDPEKFNASYEAFLNAVHPDDRDVVNVTYTDSLKTHSPYSIDYRLLFPDGRVKYVHIQCETMFVDDKPIRSVGIVQDITERKLAEQALQRLNRELRAISKCNQTLMRSVDEQILLYNICQIICEDAGYRMAWVGYAENDIAKTVRPVSWAGVESGYLKDIMISWGNTDRGHGPSGMAIRSGKSICTHDFTTDPKIAPWRDSALQRGYHSSVALPLKDESGNAFGVLNIYSSEPNTFTPDEIRLMEELSGDLAFGIVALRTRAERKRAESQKVEALEAMRRAKEQAEAANRYKTEFLTNISHELRTPLNAILGFAYILKSVNMSEEYQKSVDFINDRGKHLLSLVESILDVSKIESGKAELKSEEFDLLKLLNNLITKASTALEGKNVAIVLSIDGTIPKVKGDVERVGQIIENLLSNAVKYTEHGEIKLTVKPDNEQPDPKKYRIRISVKDTGIGIPEEKLPYIFDPFSRFHEFYKGKSIKGTGMGLHIVEDLVRLMGGEIHITSNVDKGSEFIVTLNFDNVKI
jgi:PAS domain S-box-containing protein